MQVTFSPQALPGSCYLCGSASREFYVDTECTVEFHGAMYICNICCEAIAVMIKYMSPIKYKEVVARAEGLETEVYFLTRKLTAAEGALREFINGGFLNPNVLDYDGDSPLVSEQVNEFSSAREEQVGNRKRKTAQSSDDKGMVELRSDASSDESLDSFFNLVGPGSSTRAE